jgi:hypothetical protein
MKKHFTRRPIDLPKHCIVVLLKESDKGTIVATVKSEGGIYYKSIEEFEVTHALQIATELSKEHGIPFFIDTGRVQWDDDWGELNIAFNERQ